LSTFIRVGAEKDLIFKVSTASAFTSVTAAKGYNIFRLNKTLWDGTAFVYDLEF
jgi:hypothetical protein